jgi:Leucine-rich repeat (LRR) protein
MFLSSNFLKSGFMKLLSIICSVFFITSTQLHAAGTTDAWPSKTNGRTAEQGKAVEAASRVPAGARQADVTGDGSSEPVLWTEITLAVADNKTGTLSKGARDRAGWNSGAVSVQRLEEGADGWFEATVDRRAWRQAIGFSETNTDNHFTTIDYCIYLSPFRVEIHEKGARRGSFGRYSMGDTFGISRENGKIHYKRNGETFYVSSKTSTEKLMVDASLYFRRSRFANVVVSVTEEEPQLEPAGDVVVSDVGPYSSTISWTDGSGDGRIVIVGLKDHAYPVDGEDYADGGHVYGQGDAVDALSYVVFDGNASSSVAVQGLGESTKYNIQIVEYVVDGGKKYYGRAAFASSSFTTGRAASYPVQWTEITGAEADPQTGTLTKSGANGWNSGAVSAQRLQAGEDGWVEVHIEQTNKARYIGLSTDNPNNNYRSMNYAIMLTASRSCRVSENGMNRGFFGTYAAGDRMAIARQGNTILYKRNDEVFYVSTTPGTGELMADASLYQEGARLSNVVVSENFGSSGQVPDALELEALTALYNEMGGTSWEKSENWLNGSTAEDFAGWQGVTVIEGDVTALDLKANNLSGTIPPEMGNLAALSSLNLYDNQISGIIPPEIGDLTSITTLYLYNNQIGGTIPPEIGEMTGLKTLVLSGNQLTGPIPAEIGNLSALELLVLSNNELSGAIPAELGNLSALASLTLSDNQLSGAIPEELGNLTALSHLHLQKNQLSGQIPAELGNLSSLIFLNLYDNQLSGEIPGEIGNLSTLTELRLEENELSGSIPAQLGSLSALTSLSLWGNQLSGAIPPEIGNLSALTTLQLYDNQLSGSIPAQVGNLSALTALQLYKNELSGSIPPALGNLSTLNQLLLYENELSGEIPGELGAIAGLNDIRLNNNQLSGEIPAGLGNLNGLLYLYLNHNQLSGEIPTALGNTQWLRDLRLDHNQLTGAIPTEIGALTRLRYLRLDNNELAGTIPQSIMDLKDPPGGPMPPAPGNPGPEVPDGDAHFQIQANKFTFADFPLSGTTSIVYAPQDSVDVSVSQAVGIGELLILLADIDRGTTPACKYQWYKDGVPLTDAPTEDGYTDTITVSGAADAGSYHYTITHDRLPNLTLTSRVQEVTLTVPPIQREALIALYNATDGDNWTGIPEDKKWKQNGAFTDDISNWYGITLDGDGQVQIIVLQDKGLNGSIPKEIGNLSSLVRLYLDYNQLSGSIPKEIGDLSRLRSLGLIDNQLSGSIPPEIWNLSSLEYLKLHRNKLSGSIPWQIGNLSSLKWLSLEGNELSGSIPPEIGNLSSLVVLYLFDNQLSGSIPPEIGNLSSLRSLYLNSNELSGSIPPEIGNLSSLDRLYLHENELSGSIPQEIGNLSSVEYLNLSWNQLSGSIPPEIGNLSSLDRLYLHENELSGSIPPEFGNLSNLGRLYLYGNQLSGSIPREIGDMSSLEVLSLSNNQLSGSIPPEILNKGNKWSIFYNNFTFSDFPLSSPTPTINYIPQNEVDESHNFQSFVGQSLTLVANIDRSVTPPCKYQWFKDGTPLTDAPTEDGHTFTIASVTAADAGSYHYTITHDRLPTITLTSRLQEVVFLRPIQQSQKEALIAFYNSTDGDHWTNIPEEKKWKQEGQSGHEARNWEGITIDENGKVVQIDLQDKGLRGTVPEEISALSSLRVLDLSHNMLQGEVPIHLARLDNLEELYLNNNEFEGYMDLEFSVMPNIRVMALQHNDLVSIPDFSFNNLVDPLQVTLNTENNKLEFYYIENNLNTDGTDILGTFTYMPQKTYGEPKILGFIEENELSLKVNMLGRANHYQWQFSSDQGQSWVNVGDDNPEYSKLDIKEVDDKGWYRVRILNDRADEAGDEILSAIYNVRIEKAPVAVNRPEN